MATTSRPTGELVKAADHFEQELARYEKLCTEVQRTTVHSEKSLMRRRRLLLESAESEQELGVRLQGLLVAMNGARDRQQRSMEMALAAANDLQERAAQFNALMAKVGALGERAREVSQPASQAIADGVAAEADFLAPLEQVGEHIHSVLTDADAIARSADEQNWPEIARDVKSLGQQLQSLHDKLTRLRTDVAKRAPS